MSRPRRYRTQPAFAGPTGWAIFGECLFCTAETGERPPYCGHWVPLDGRWPTEAAAVEQIRIWTARQQLLLDVAGPQRLRRPKAAA